MAKPDGVRLRCLFTEIAKAIAPGAHAVLLVDQAGWHASGLVLVKRANQFDQVITAQRPFPAIGLSRDEWMALGKAIPLADYVNRVAHCGEGVSRDECAAHSLARPTASTPSAATVISRLQPAAWPTCRPTDSSRGSSQWALRRAASSRWARAMVRRRINSAVSPAITAIARNRPASERPAVKGSKRCASRMKATSSPKPTAIAADNAATAAQISPCGLKPVRTCAVNIK